MPWGSPCGERSSLSTGLAAYLSQGRGRHEEVTVVLGRWDAAGPGRALARADRWCGGKEACRAISIGQLHALLHFHFRPIDVVVCHGPDRETSFQGGFPA